MDIRILQGTDGAARAEGLAVIIDVFRAFSVACYVMDNGAEKIIPVERVETAFALQQEDSDVVLIGERNERKVAGFDFGNSPSEILDVSFTGLIVVQTTSAGTQGIGRATQAREIITGSFVNAEAICRYIRKQDPGVLSLVCMGMHGKTPTDEDSLLAEYISASLSGSPPDFAPMKKQIRQGSGSRFFSPGNAGHSPPDDFFLCLDLNRFDFILRAYPYRKGLVQLKKISLDHE